METYLTAGTKVETFKVVKSNTEGNMPRYAIRHIFTMADYSAICVDNDGKVKLISSNARSVLNEVGHKSAIGNDTDYL